MSNKSSLLEGKKAKKKVGNDCSHYLSLSLSLSVLCSPAFYPRDFCVFILGFRSFSSEARTFAAPSSLPVCASFLDTLLLPSVIYMVDMLIIDVLDYSSNQLRHHLFPRRSNFFSRLANRKKRGPEASDENLISWFCLHQLARVATGRRG